MKHFYVLIVLVVGLVSANIGADVLPPGEYRDNISRPGCRNCTYNNGTLTCECLDALPGHRGDWKKSSQSGCASYRNNRGSLECSLPGGSYGSLCRDCFYKAGTLTCGSCAWPKEDGNGYNYNYNPSKSGCARYKSVNGKLECE